MRLAVVNNCVPFVSGGAEHLASALVGKLQEYGHEAILVRIPFRWEPPEKIVEHMLACRFLRLPNVERVIALKFPAYYIPHRGKVLWLLHQFRQAYDLWGTPFQGLPNDERGREIRRTIIQADNTYLREVEKIFTNSPVTSERLKKFNDLDSEVLWPPLASNTQFFCEGYGDYILCLGRITASKRQRLAVEAMRFVTTSVRLVVAGQFEDSAEHTYVTRLISEYGLEDRVQLIPRFISEEEKARLLSRALACAYLPYDEDSYGYVTLEAYYSSKPVLTCSDSGGITLVVRNGATGIICEPDARQIAQSMDNFFLDRSQTEKMGKAGHALVQSWNISWDNVIARLTT
jgi:glycosyltransferase involved in cell wall biosynthesis